VNTNDRVWLSLLGGFKRQLPDLDPQETQEWIDALDAVIEKGGRERADFLLRRLLKRARQQKLGLPGLIQSRYINTISPEQEPPFPGDEKMELRIRRIVRWNAAVMVVRANKISPGIGGHLSSYASSASLYEVGFNHFFRGKDETASGDQIFFQGHAAPGVYARAFLEGRLTELQLAHFRREVKRIGLSSYPHPRLMPDFWEFPSVSMGLSPITAIYQARFNRYLHARGLADTEASRVWAFLGDGECDEPEALGALTLAAREGLDNLTFVVNCNLQRLDGPVRGNGKIIQELEAAFTGAGWNVIKVVWGREWDDLLANDYEGLLVDRMNEALDGDYQKYATESGAYIREHFFGTNPKLLEMVKHLSDDDLKRLRRGGHDYRKLYAAYSAAVNHKGRPTCILAKTVKGWTLGRTAEGSNVAHQVKKMDLEELKKFRDRIHLEITDKQIEDDLPFFHPGKDSPEVEYLLERRRSLGGCMPKRLTRAQSLEVPDPRIFEEFARGTPDDQPVSTTMAFSRLLSLLLRDHAIGKRVVPIIPDEARTFGMEALFRQVGIYAPFGQKYEPVDSKFVLSYTEKPDGQLLEEGITEAGSMASFTAAGTSYASHSLVTIPFYTFYSMFGFQRTMDQIWAFADARGRGFLMGGTAGRTTLNGEGLQHQDGHSHLLASAMPNVRAYDPGFAFELALIVKDGLERMAVKQEDVFYYITIYNENYAMPEMPVGSEKGILRGIYLFKKAPIESERKVILFGSGPLIRSALAAQQMLAEQFQVAADVYSVTSYQLLRNDALEVERYNRMHPGAKPRVPYLRQVLGERREPIIAVCDYVKAVPGLVAGFAPNRLIALGTDGFGRSDTRDELRRFFEVDAEYVTMTALDALVQERKIEPDVVARAMQEFGIEPDTSDPRVS
jgi:pyruvate dehydrogenase E1 component